VVRAVLRPLRAQRRLPPRGQARVATALGAASRLRDERERGVTRRGRAGWARRNGAKQPASLGGVRGDRVPVRAQHRCPYDASTRRSPTKAKPRRQAGSFPHRSHRRHRPGLYLSRSPSGPCAVLVLRLTLFVFFLFPRPPFPVCAAEKLAASCPAVTFSHKRSRGCRAPRPVPPRVPGGSRIRVTVASNSYNRNEPAFPVPSSIPFDVSCGPAPSTFRNPPRRRPPNPPRRRTSPFARRGSTEFNPFYPRPPPGAAGANTPTTPQTESNTKSGDG